MNYTLSNEKRKEILEDWRIINLPKEEQIIKIYEKVRDIPFGTIGSRDPYDVYKANKGTCSGKNFLVRELYKAIEVKTKDMICLQRWKDLTWFPDDEYNVVNLPAELNALFEKDEIVDFHNYIKIYNDNKWIQVDVTIDLPLKELGFHVEENWDGKTYMPLCFVGTHKVWDCGDDGPKKKAELIAQLPKCTEDARKNFLKELTKWIDQWRSKKN